LLSTATTLPDARATQARDALRCPQSVAVKRALIAVHAISATRRTSSKRPRIAGGPFGLRLMRLLVNDAR
jgi:hypothetical protein